MWNCCAASVWVESDWIAEWCEVFLLILTSDPAWVSEFNSEGEMMAYSEVGGWSDAELIAWDHKG